MPATKNRVVITGLGVLTPVGATVDAYWNALLIGQSGAARITRFDTTGHSVTFAAEVKNFDPGQYMDPKEAKRMDLFSQYAVAAAKGAVQDCGIDFSKEDRFRCGAIIASGIGGLTEMQEQDKKCNEKGPGRISPSPTASAAPTGASLRPAPPPTTRWAPLSARSSTGTPTSCSPAAARRR